MESFNGRCKIFAPIWEASGQIETGIPANLLKVFCLSLDGGWTDLKLYSWQPRHIDRDHFLPQPIFVGQ
jgi:hypothetical protein